MAVSWWGPSGKLEAVGAPCRSEGVDVVSQRSHLLEQIFAGSLRLHLQDMLKIEYVKFNVENGNENVKMHYKADQNPAASRRSFFGARTRAPHLCSLPHHTHTFLPVETQLLAFLSLSLLLPP